MTVAPPAPAPAITPNYWTFTTLPFDRSVEFPSNPEFRNVFANDIHVYDVNGDGHLDVVQIYSFIPNQNLPGIPIRVLLGDGHGAFTDGTATLFGSNVPLGDAATGGARADFNGDGVDDLLISQHGYDQPPFPGMQNRLLLSNGANGVVDATSTLPQISDFTHWSTAGDIDGDYDVDIFVLNLGSIDNNRDPYFLLNNGSGNFTRSDAQLPAAIDTGSAQYQSTLLFDADNDDDLDLFIGVWGPQAALLNNGAIHSLVLLNDGAGHFSQTSASALPDPIWAANLRNALGVQAADITGDGYNDLLAIMADNSGNSYIQVLVNNGDGTFRDETATRVPFSPQSGARYLHLVDVNADGSLDIVEQTGGPTRFFLNDGTGRFVALPADFLFTNGGNYSFVPGDFNEDGRLDFFVRTFVNDWDDPAHVTEFDWIATWTQPAGTTLRGDGAANAVLGVGANETLSGLGGDDVVFGAAGKDTLKGGTGNDVLVGGLGVDRLFGQDGDDTLTGSAGRDILEGGKGTDTLTGGTETDRFVYKSIRDSVAGSTRDITTDFTSGEDHIDLRKMDANSKERGNQAFTFIFDNSFSGSAGELRFDDGILSGDRNGDKLADFEVIVQNISMLMEIDILL